MIAAVLFAWTTIITDRVCRKHDSLSVGIVYVGIIGAVLILAGILGMRKVQGGLVPASRSAVYILELFRRTCADIDVVFRMGAEYLSAACVTAESEQLVSEHSRE